MAAPLALLFICVAAFFGLGLGINFFWQTGIKQAFKYAGLILGIMIIFALSGLWITGNRYAWGFLTPIFALMLVAGWVSYKFSPKLWSAIRKFFKQN